MISLEDLIEEIIGEEIVDETDRYMSNIGKKAARRTSSAEVMKGIIERERKKLVRMNSISEADNPRRRAGEETASLLRNGVGSDRGDITPCEYRNSSFALSSRLSTADLRNLHHRRLSHLDQPAACHLGESSQDLSVATHEGWDVFGRSAAPRRLAPLKSRPRPHPILPVTSI